MTKHTNLNIVIEDSIHYDSLKMYKSLSEDDYSIIERICSCNKDNNIQIFLNKRVYYAFNNGASILAQHLYKKPEKGECLNSTRKYDVLRMPFAIGYICNLMSISQTKIIAYMSKDDYDAFLITEKLKEETEASLLVNCIPPTYINEIKQSNVTAPSRYFEHTKKDITEMKEYVNEYSNDELLSADVCHSPNDFIFYFVVGKEIGKSMSVDEWNEYIEIDNDADNMDFILPRYCKTANCQRTKETFGDTYRFLVDMGVTAYAYNKGIFPISDGACITSLDDNQKTQKIKEKIRNYGYIRAEEFLEMWNNIEDEEDRDFYPVDEIGNPQRDAFYSALSQDFWEGGLEAMEAELSIKRYIKKQGGEKVGEIYFEGVDKFVETKFKKQ